MLFHTFICFHFFFFETCFILSSDDHMKDDGNNMLMSLLFYFRHFAAVFGCWCLARKAARTINISESSFYECKFH